MPRPRLHVPNYRSDIDGLRALAILAVLGYHAFPAVVRGGFVGVDVFFVISGFLITSIIVGSMPTGTAPAEHVDCGSFTFSAFYARRICRLFPALIVVLPASIAIGWFVLVPADYVNLGQHVLGGVGFVSNLLLLLESGYFDAAAQIKPLLHLWSLGVEEQFYLLWPPLLLVSRRLRLDTQRVTAMVAALSFAGCLLLLGRHPAAAFYLPLTRLWELLVGGLLAHRALAADARASDAATSKAQECTAFAGLALMGWAIVAFNAADAFPGWRALLPTLGTALLIAAGPGTRIARRLLCLPAMVAIGLISYPLYLWHWPLLSFARIYTGGEVAPWLRGALVAASFALAWATYRWIEVPFRFRLRRSTSVIVLSLLMAATAAAGAVLVRAQGFQSRMGEPLRPYLGYDYSQYHAAAREGSCELIDANQPIAFPPVCMDPPTADGRPLVVLWGDSHAAMLYPGMRAIAGDRSVTGKGLRIAQFTRAGCRPFLGIGYDACRQGNDLVLQTIARTHPDYVVLFSHWNHLKFHSGAEMLQQLEPTLTALKRLGVPRIVVLGPAPRWFGTLPADLVRQYAEHPFLRIPARSRYGLNPDAIALDAFLQDTLGRRLDLRYFSVIRTLCDARGCLTHVGNDPVLTTWDYGHLSRPAAIYVAQHLAADMDGFTAVTPAGTAGASR